MATSVAQVIALVKYELNDEDATRWTTDELVAWISEAQRAVAAIRPVSNAVLVAVSLVPGAKQAIPTNGFVFLSATCNTASDGTPTSAVRRVDRELLDVHSPDWYAETATSTVLTYSADSTMPTRFWVYPPSNGSGYLEILYGVMPENVTPFGNIALPSKYVSALVNYVLYRCFMKDAEFAGNAELSVGYYKAFSDAVAAVK